MSDSYPRILVTGSREWPSIPILRTVLAEFTTALDGGVIVHGDCPTGADKMADDWAVIYGWLREPHPAEWMAPCGPECKPGHRKNRGRGGDYCPYAGFRRNQEMVDLGADLCVAFIANRSNGATDCTQRAEGAGIPLRIIRYETSLR